MTLDAEQAIRRYQQQAYQALIVDAGSVAQDGVEAYRRVLVEAKAKKEKLAAVLILNEDQAGWGKAVENLAGGRILIRPVKMRDVLEALGENLPELQDYDHHGEE
jgi:hypothetical protein